MTVEDLRTTSNQTGFKGVQRVGGQPSRGVTPTYFQGIVSVDGERKVLPGRHTPEAAAQDIIDFWSSNPIVPSDPRGRAGVKRAGHVFSGTPEEIPSDIEAAYGMIRDFKAQQSGKPGYVYLIVEQWPSGTLAYGKIGYSTNPQKRVAELQTGNPRTLKLYATRLGSLEDEAVLHKRHIDKNVLQEWFRLDDALLSEFPTTEEDA